MKRTAVILMVCISMVLAGGLAGAAEPVKAGGVAPNFSLPELGSGKTIGLDSILGKTPYTVLTFTNSVCVVCRYEMINLVKFDDAHKGKMSMVAVFTDVEPGPMTEKMAKMFKDRFVYLVDSKFSTPSAYGFQFTPGLVLLDKAGNVLWVKAGFPLEETEKFQAELGSYVK